MRSGRCRCAAPDPGSSSYPQMVGSVAMPNVGDELHHFGWNACSSCLCPNAPHPHSERRYLIVPGLRSSRIHILDTKTDPRKPEIVRVLEPQEVAECSRYTRPHTVHCAGRGSGRCVSDGPQDFRHSRPMGNRPWAAATCLRRVVAHLGYDTLVTSEWGLPATFENGLVPEVLLGGKYGHKLHFWDLHERKHLQEVDFGAENQLVFELRPAHDPTKACGFFNPVISLKDLSASIWTWYREGKRLGGQKGD
jgi:selenium-binding protein 1